MAHLKARAKHSIKKTAIASAVAMAIGVAGLPSEASAENLAFNWSGFFTVLDSAGGALANVSITSKSANRYQTPVSGTMTFDTDMGTGTATMMSFDFFNGSSPVEAVSINMQAIGDGVGGPGPLIMGNFLFNWDGNDGIPITLVWDAQGLLNAINGGLSGGDTVSSTGAVPASDGTYVGSMFGYLSLGPTPMASTEWNVTRTAACGIGQGNCTGVSPSGELPLVVDTAVNYAEYAMGDGIGISGVPMWDGPFVGLNINFDMTTLSLAGPPKPTITMLIPGGSTQECSSTGGRDASMNANVASLGDDEIDTISWLLDGVPVASGVSVEFFIPLGAHTVETILATVMGETASATQSLTVKDTVRPDLSVAFLNTRTGAEITSLESQQKADISINASDVCDPSPTSSATAGIPVLDGDRVNTHTFKKNSSTSLSIKGSVDNIEVTATAEDASGNMSNSRAVLTVIP